MFSFTLKNYGPSIAASSTHSTVLLKMARMHVKSNQYLSPDISTDLENLSLNPQYM